MKYISYHRMSIWRSQLETNLLIFSESWQVSWECTPSKYP